MNKIGERMLGEFHYRGKLRNRLLPTIPTGDLNQNLGIFVAIGRGAATQQQ